MAIRPRNPWEAMDLGFSLVRAWWWPVYRVWLALVLPLFVLLQLVFHERLWLAAVVLWWLKPLLDRALLHVFARAVFGEPPGVRATLRALPRLLRTGLLWHLTLLRLDTIRSFRLPVLQLEGLSGRARAERIRALGQRVRSHATGLTLICVHLELFVQLGAIGLLLMLVPEGMDLGPGVFLGESAAVQLTLNGVYVLAMSLIEPAYVGAGLGLYLSRRTRLEGWDIELSFRRMARRLEALAQGAAAVLVVALLLMPWVDARAAIADQPLAPRALPESEVPRVIQEVLEDPIFGSTRTVTRWERLAGDAQDESDWDPELGWLQGLGNLLARVTEILLWASAAILAAFVLAWVVRAWRPASRLGRHRSAEPVALPETVAGMDIRPDSLPGDIPAAVLSLWRAGQPRPAMGLLYRAAISRLVHRHRLELADSATEGEVLREVHGRVSRETAAYLGRATRLWVATAYAHQAPSESELLELLGAWSGSMEEKA